MRIIKKGFLYLKKEGIFPAIKKTFEKCLRKARQFPFRIIGCVTAPDRIKDLQVSVKDKTVFLLVPGIDWNIPLFQRPHQIAVELSKREDVFVFFLPDQYKYDLLSFDKKVNDRLYLLSLFMVKHIDKILSGCREVVIMMTWTRHIDILSKIRHDILIYDYVDEINLFYYYDKQMEYGHRFLMQNANFTLATSDRLYAKAKDCAKKALLCENAGDYAFFSNIAGCETNPLIADTVIKYDAVIGYYGCLAYWFDYETVLLAAERQTNWLFVLVGHDFDGTGACLLKSKLSNILYIQAQPYKELPSFLKAFDIAIVPFLINEITNAVSPVKIFEYMAAGKPVLSSDMPECRKYASVYRYHNVDDFIDMARLLIDKRGDAEYTALLNKEAKENTWESRVNAIIAATRNEI